MKTNQRPWKMAFAQISVGICLFSMSGCESERTPLPAGGTSRTSGAEQSTSQDSEDPLPGTESNVAGIDWDGKAESLIPETSLKDWESIEFGGEGDCRVEKGVMLIESGERLTGVSLTRDDLPKTNYEISMKTRRVDGIDFFCGLTFPVDDSHCTLIVGGWAGATVGLSCVDDLDASSNETCKYMSFETEQWYRIRVRVLPEKIVVWIDDEEVISQLLHGHVISLRSETLPCRPLGLCTYQTTSETKELKIRRIKPSTQESD